MDIKITIYKEEQVCLIKKNMAPQELLVAGAALRAGIFDALWEKPTVL